jgi:hypothetical protein
MLIPPPDQRFIEARRERRRMGLLILPVFLTLLIGAWVLFFIMFPMTVNPWVVIGRIEQQQLEPGTLTMYAVTATILMNVVFALLGALLVMSIAWARHERRYLKLLGQPVAPSAPDAPAGPDPSQRP